MSRGSSGSAACDKKRPSLMAAAQCHVTWPPDPLKLQSPGYSESHLDSDYPPNHVTVDVIRIRYLRLLETPVVDTLTFAQFQHWDAFSNGDI